jgi:hypothetical protein
MQRALRLKKNLARGISITLDEIDTDENFAMDVIEEEQGRRDEERSKS